MEVFFKSFAECSQQEIFDFYYLRSEVFVVEQNCAYQDVDEKDLKSLHVLFRDEEKLAAYCRILPPGLSYPETAIGRVVVPKKERSKGYAKELMRRSIDYCFVHFPQHDIVISAQSYLDQFYCDLNFITEGKAYLEDNIPHQKMRLKYHQANDSSNKGY